MNNIKLSDLEFTKNVSLGKGSYGEVELAKHKKTGKNFAVKKIDKQSLANKKIRATLNREVQIQKQIKHENIVR
jgi:serine/threonine protein kinase